MQATLHRDKIFLDVTDTPELAELFSRKEPGDKVKGSFEASMDEKSDGMVVMSIDNIQFKAGKGSKSASGVKNDGDGDEPSSVSAMKAQAEPDEDEEEIAPTESPDKEGSV